jgi:hypothetical protein
MRKYRLDEKIPAERKNTKGRRNSSHENKNQRIKSELKILARWEKTN